MTKQAQDTVMNLSMGRTDITVRLYPKAMGNGGIGLCCDYEIFSKAGDKLGEGSIITDLRGIRRKVMEVYAEKTANTVGSWSWDEMKVRAKRISKRVGAKKLLRTVQRIAADPRFQKGAAMASAIYPPFGITYGTVIASAKLLERVRSGDEMAQGKLLAIKQLAESGDPKAQRVSKAMYAMNQAAKQGADVSGWALNLPYRNNLAAGSLDKTNPGHKARFLYNLALTR